MPNCLSLWWLASDLAQNCWKIRPNCQNISNEICVELTCNQIHKKVLSFCHLEGCRIDFLKSRHSLWFRWGQPGSLVNLSLRQMRRSPQVGPAIGRIVHSPARCLIQIHSVRSSCCLRWRLLAQSFVHSSVVQSWGHCVKSHRIRIHLFQERRTKLPKPSKIELPLVSREFVCAVIENLRNMVDSGC